MRSHKTLTLILTTLFILLELGMIFLFSAQNGDTSGSLSRGITDFLLRLLGNDPDTMTAKEWSRLVTHWGLYVRKAAHMTEFGLLAVLFTLQLRGITRLRFPWLPALGITAVFAAADEYHQTFVNGRAGVYTDVLIDLSGAVIGVLLCMGLIGLYHCIRRRRERKRAAQE